ncbi:Hypothetical protein CINCED_3A015705, partial [Cinara cedri]
HSNSLVDGNNIKGLIKSVNSTANSKKNPVPIIILFNLLVINLLADIKELDKGTIKTEKYSEEKHVRELIITYGTKMILKLNCLSKEQSNFTIDEIENQKEK